MTKHEMVVSVLQSLGFKPQIDDEGDIFVRYQMKTFYVMGLNSDDEDYLVVVFPQMYEVNEGEETKVLAVCNKITREIKLTKVYIDQTLKNVSASCEFYYNGEESLKTCLDKAQSCPGALAVNMSVFIGYRMRKLAGAICATLGVTLPSFLIILLIAMFFHQFQDNAVVASAFNGIRPAVVALIAAPVFTLAKSARIALTSSTG